MMFDYLVYRVELGYLTADIANHCRRANLRYSAFLEEDISFWKRKTIRVVHFA